MEKANGKRKNYYLMSPLSEYFTGFLSGLFMRESCYQCPYASLERAGDITLGDFWGYQKTRPELRHDEGLSLILVNTEKGKRLFRQISGDDLQTFLVDQNSIEQSENKNLYFPTGRPEVRDSIYSELDRDGFAVIAQKYMSFGQTTKNKIKNFIPAKIRRFMLRR